MVKDCIERIKKMTGILNSTEKNTFEEENCNLWVHAAFIGYDSCIRE